MPQRAAESLGAALLATLVLSAAAAGAAATNGAGADVAGADPTGTQELKPFEAHYAWIWRGMTVAATTVKLERTGDTWTYSSRSEPRGIGRFVSQRPKTMSVVKVTDAKVEPLSYKADDGTGSTRHKVDVTYDQETHRVKGVYEDTPVDLPLRPGLQDDSSVQVALMVALVRGQNPEHFSLLDKNAVRDYSYTREGEETLRTPFGEVRTVIYRSQRANSPHVNRYWCAPGRGFVPIRVQQKRGDEVQWTMEIEGLKRE